MLSFCLGLRPMAEVDYKNSKVLKPLLTKPRIVRNCILRYFSAITSISKSSVVNV